MPVSKKRRPLPPKLASNERRLPTKLSKIGEDLLWHMTHGHQVETSSLGDKSILRQLKDDAQVRATANRRTIETLQQLGLIAIAKAGGVIKPTVWRLTAKGKIGATRRSACHRFPGK